MPVTNATRAGTPWTTSELETLRMNYPIHGLGWDGWEKVLPNRTMDAIRRQAFNHGLTSGKRPRQCVLPNMSAEVTLASIAVSALDPEKVEALREMMARAVGQMEDEPHEEAK